MNCLHCKDTRIDPERIVLFKDEIKIGCGSREAMLSEFAKLVMKGENTAVVPAPCSGCGEGKLPWEREAA